MDWRERLMLAAPASEAAVEDVVTARPRTAEETAQVVKIAISHLQELHIAPGTGPDGQRTAPGIALDLVALKGAALLDGQPGLLRAAAGERLADLETLANRSGISLGCWPFVPDLTLAGYIGEGEPGPASPAHGSVLDRILSWEGVLPTGEIYRSRLAPATAAGPDLWRVMAGARGSLGVTTGAVIALTPRPGYFLTGAFEGLADAVAWIRALFRQRLIPPALAAVLGDGCVEVTLGFPERHPLAPLAAEALRASRSTAVAATSSPDGQRAWARWRGVPLDYEALLAREPQLRELGAGWEAPLLIAGFAHQGAQVFAPADQIEWRSVDSANEWLWRGLKQRLDPDALFQPGTEPRQGGLPWNR